jgi:hypothetical protein
MKKELIYKIFDGLTDCTPQLGEFKTLNRAREAALIADWSVNYSRHLGEYRNVVGYSKIELLPIAKPKTILRRSK